MADRNLESELSARYTGVPVIDVPVFPEDLGGGNNETNVIFTDPRNDLVGMWRRIKMETDRLVREGVLLIVTSMRFDMKYQHEPAVVKASGVTVS